MKNSEFNERRAQETPFLLADSKRIANIEGLVNVVLAQQRELLEKLSYLGLVPEEEPQPPEDEKNQFPLPKIKEGN
jgi:hypothetical protein